MATAAPTPTSAAFPTLTRSWSRPPHRSRSNLSGLTAEHLSRGSLSASPGPPPDSNVRPPFPFLPLLPSFSERSTLFLSPSPCCSEPSPPPSSLRRRRCPLDFPLLWLPLLLLLESLGTLRLLPLRRRDVWFFPGGALSALLSRRFLPPRLLLLSFSPRALSFLPSPSLHSLSSELRLRLRLRLRFSVDVLCFLWSCSSLPPAFKNREARNRIRRRGTPSNKTRGLLYGKRRTVLNRTKLAATKEGQSCFLWPCSSLPAAFNYPATERRIGRRGITIETTSGLLYGHYRTVLIWVSFAV